MAEQYILNMEEGQIQREIPVLRPYDVVEYRGAPSSQITFPAGGKWDLGGRFEHLSILCMLYKKP